MGWSRPFGRLTHLRRTRSRDGAGLPGRTMDLLSEPLNEDLVSERETRDGRIVQYLEGWAAIHQANRIFGPDQWGAELIDGVSYHPSRLIDDVSGDQLATGIYTATVRVSVRGCLPKSDIGCAFVRRDMPEEHEAACKGAVTDATKRALRQFGAQFGNELYNRRAEADESGSQSPVPAITGKLDELRAKVFDLSARLGADSAKAEAWAEKRYGHRLDGLTAEQLADAVRMLAGQLNRRNGASPKRPNARGGSGIA
jgi:DNA repair and recombination protein RAD52